MNMKMLKLLQSEYAKLNITIREKLVINYSLHF